MVEILDFLLANYAWYLVVMMTLIIAITNTILMFGKKPIKKLTAKIGNEQLRKLANKVFVLLAFLISGLCWYCLSLVSTAYFPFNFIVVLLTGAFSIVIHELGDGVITNKEAKFLVESVKEIVKDGKVDGEDKTAVKEFWDKVK